MIRDFRCEIMDINLTFFLFLITFLPNISDLHERIQENSNLLNLFVID